MPATVRRLFSADLRPSEIDELRALLTEAFGDDPDEAFGEHDWAHALGGVHVLVEDDGRIVAHAAVVARTIEVGGRPLRTGYVEAVATRADAQGRGFGTAAMTEVGSIIRDGYELGMLGTGRQGFYERLGWWTWRGPSGFHDAITGAVRTTPDDDGYLMVLTTPATPPLDGTAPIVCEWRPGDVW
jgi:aminoglycoside 2'-N-acetyltransferase I